MSQLAASTLISGHTLLSDWLLLIGAIVFALAALLAFLPVTTTTTTDPPRTYPVWLGHGFLIALGLTLIAVGWLVL